jgi:hypothetical protein
MLPVPVAILTTRNLACDAPQVADDGEEFLHPYKTKGWFLFESTMQSIGCGALLIPVKRLTESFLLQQSFLPWTSFTWQFSAEFLWKMNLDGGVPGWKFPPNPPTRPIPSFPVFHHASFVIGFPNYEKDIGTRECPY